MQWKLNNQTMQLHIIKEGLMTQNLLSSPQRKQSRAHRNHRWYHNLPINNMKRVYSLPEEKPDSAHMKKVSIFDEDTKKKHNHWVNASLATGPTSVKSNEFSLSP